MTCSACGFGFFLFYCFGVKSFLASWWLRFMKLKRLNICKLVKSWIKNVLWERILKLKLSATTLKSLKTFNFKPLRQSKTFNQGNVVIQDNLQSWLLLHFLFKTIIQFDPLGRNCFIFFWKVLKLQQHQPNQRLHICGTRKPTCSVS